MDTRIIMTFLNHYFGICTFAEIGINITFSASILFLLFPFLPLLLAFCFGGSFIPVARIYVFLKILWNTKLKVFVIFLLFSVGC
jgi:hypothetical protein